MSLDIDSIRDRIWLHEPLSPEQAKLLLYMHDSAHRRCVAAEDSLQKVLLIVIGSLEAMLKSLRAIQQRADGAVI